jgi:hypothetical protein
LLRGDAHDFATACTLIILRILARILLHGPFVFHISWLIGLHLYFSKLLVLLCVVIRHASAGHLRSVRADGQKTLAIGGRPDGHCTLLLLQLLMLSDRLLTLVVSLEVLVRVLVILLLLEVDRVHLPVVNSTVGFSLGEATIWSEPLLACDLVLEDSAVFYFLNFLPRLLDSHALHRVYARAYVLIIQTLKWLLTRGSVLGQRTLVVYGWSRDKECVLASHLLISHLHGRGHRFHLRPSILLILFTGVIFVKNLRDQF